jgi:hypothetical protein
MRDDSEIFSGTLPQQWSGRRKTGLSTKRGLVFRQRNEDVQDRKNPESRKNQFETTKDTIKEREKLQPFDGVAFPPLRSKNPMRSYFSSPGVIASTGHCSAQVPQSVHSLGSMTYLSSPSLIASAGHSF